MNDDYKKYHKPVIDSDKVKFHQGYYYPKHPEKCLTKENVYRSGWEYFFMRYCDDSPNIVRWASEPVKVQYLNPVANMQKCVKEGLDPQNPLNWKVCNYYTDFWIEMKGQNNTIRKIFIEIKPYAQTQQPKPINENASMKEHKRYNREAETYLVNIQKWKAATKEFQSRGAEFMVVTEKTLKKLGME